VAQQLFAHAQPGGHSLLDVQAVSSVQTLNS
jgi:hypothetical protein